MRPVVRDVGPVVSAPTHVLFAIGVTDADLDRFQPGRTDIVLCVETRRQFVTVAVFGVILDVVVVIVVRVAEEIVAADDIDIGRLCDGQFRILARQVDTQIAIGAGADADIVIGDRRFDVLDVEVKLQAAGRFPLEVERRVLSDFMAVVEAGTDTDAGADRTVLAVDGGVPGAAGQGRDAGVEEARRAAGEVLGDAGRRIGREVGRSGVGAPVGLAEIGAGGGIGLRRIVVTRPVVAAVDDARGQDALTIEVQRGAGRRTHGRGAGLDEVLRVRPVDVAVIAPGRTDIVFVPGVLVVRTVEL